MNQDTTKYPRFIPDIPVGKDCFEGHSQEKLAHSVCNYVKLQDAGDVDNDTSKKQEKTIMPRIMGIEGSWGSGKSNIVNMIERELSKEGYLTFTYDAWGHQEDLQCRSILETLAINLANNKVLQGDVKIQMRNGKEHEASWKEQLSMLLSNKTTTIRKSTPRLTVFRESASIAWFEYGFEYSTWSHATFHKANLQGCRMCKNHNSKQVILFLCYAL